MSRLSIPDDDVIKSQQEHDLGHPHSHADEVLDRQSDKARDIEENVRGNRGIAEAVTDRGLTGSETEKAMKRAVERANRQPRRRR
jgi:hypothetical protein